MLTKIFENSPVGLLAINNLNEIVFANQKLLEIFGLKNNILIGCNPVEFFSGIIPYPAILALNSNHDDFHNNEHEARILINDNYYSILIQSKKNNEGDMTFLSFSDITEIKQGFEQITYLATHDTQTGLLNRNTLISEFPKFTKNASLSNQRLAVLFIDLDNFKMINDSLGHDAGDYVIHQIGHKLKGCLKQSDIAVRLGGDEFVVVLNHIESKDVNQDSYLNYIKQTAWHIADCISKPMTFDDHPIDPSASIGISIYPDHGENYSQLIKAADTAMYEAKLQGKNVCHIFSKTSVTDDKDYYYSAGLKHGIKHQELFFHYQPQINLTTHQLIGYEALIRWMTPNGLVGPDRFIPVAEKTGQIIEIGEWVAQKVIHQVSDWQDAGISIPSVSINLSPRNFVNHRIVDILDHTLTITGVQPHKICIEMTESALILDHDQVKSGLAQLKNMGIRLSLDDFGTGYSSLSLISEYEFDEIKIDRTFISQMHENKKYYSLVNAIISMCLSLDKEIMAEGVETQQHYQILKKLGCHAAQGYLFSKPLPTDQIGIKTIYEVIT